MKKTGFLLAVMTIALVVASGVALAANIEGNGGNNRLVGTNGKDTISGGGGADFIFGRGGADRLFGDSGNDDVHGGGDNDRLQVGLGQDELFGDSGNDFANAIDGQTNDIVDCGTGSADAAGVDFTRGNSATDRISPNCEAVYIAIGPFEAGELGFLSSIDTRAEAEQAKAAGLLRQR